MGFWAILTFIFKNWGDFKDITLWMKNKVESGVTQAQIKKDMKGIMDAFDENKPAHQQAGELDDIFKN